MSKEHWLALSMIRGIGGVTVQRLLDRFGDVEAVFAADDDELASIPRVTRASIASLRTVSLEAIENELMALSDEGIDVLTWDDDDYPPLLRAVSSSPPILFVCGELLPDDQHAVAVIGTRDPSPGALAQAKTVGEALAARGLSVVSGLAIGIDTAAHQGALQADGGRTLAVLGSGVRTIHPRSNAKLAQVIAERGAVLSELHPNAPVRGPQLMARDRIISGLARAVIVIEAGERSGSVDTAERGRKQGRLIMALPGSPGTDALLSQGAEELETSDVDWDALAERLRAHEPDPTVADSPQQLNLL